MSVRRDPAVRTDLRIVVSPLLDGLSDAQRRAVLSRARRRRFRRREVIFHAGDPGDAVHLVVSGHVGLRITTPLGDAAMVRVLGAGEFFGELALLVPGPRNATAFAIESAETQSMSTSVFDELRTQSASAQEALTLALVTEIRRLAGALVEALYLPADQRLWRRLSELATSYPEGDALPLTQEEVAQLAGTTRQSANKLLREAEEAGAVVLTRGRIEITDPKWVTRRCL